MKRTILIILSVIALAQIGYAVDERDEMGLREFLLNDGFSTYAQTNEICYIAFGAVQGTNAFETIYTDPPDSFLLRFEGRHFSVKKASQYPYPRREERVSVPNNPLTGIPDGIYTVEIIEWIDGTTAKVRYSIYRKPLWGSAYEAIAEKNDGQWHIKQHGMMTET